MKNKRPTQFAGLDKALGIISDLNTMPSEIDEENNEPIELPEPTVKYEKGSGKQIEINDVLDDFEFVRKTMHHVIHQGQTALSCVMQSGAVTTHPRAFEVASTIMSNINEATKSLLDLHQQMYDIHQKQLELKSNTDDADERSSKKITGTTAEILAQIAENAKTKEK